MPKILIIDNKKDSLINISALIQNLIPGSIIITAQSREEGINKSEQELPDTILLDVGIPETGEFEVCKILKSKEKTRHIPVIMINGAKTDSQGRLRAFETGADAFLAKPIAEAELIAQVKAMLRIKAAEDLLRQEKDLLKNLIQEINEELQDTEERYQLLFNTTNDAVFVHHITESGKPGQLIDANEVACRRLGYTKEELLRLTPSELENPLSLSKYTTVVERSLKEKHILFEDVHITKEGRAIPVEISTQLFHLNGRPAVLSTARDITKRKQAEKDLHRGNRTLHLMGAFNQALVHAVNEMNLLASICQIVTEIGRYPLVWIGYKQEDENKSVKPVAQLGFDKGHLKEETLTWADTERGKNLTGAAIRSGKLKIYRDILSNPQYDVGEAARQGCRSLITLPLTIKNHTFATLNIYSTEADDFDGEEVKLLADLARELAYGIDVLRTRAEHEGMEKALQKERALLARRVGERTAELSTANAELARAARQKDEFLASMSHELRTPLNAILGMCEALQQEAYGSLQDTQIKPLQNIEQSGRHLLSLINDILDVSKIAAGKLDLQIEPVSIESVCNASLRFIKQNAHKKRLKVTTTVDSSVKTFMTDERRLKQILINLLSNAVKFTPKGGEIGLDVFGDAKKQIVSFTVWDTGIGISQQDMTHLFKPFVQLDTNLSRQNSGTGLGLALVYRLADLNGGGVSVQSEVNKGSRFSVTLPMRRAPVQKQPVIVDREQKPERASALMQNQNAPEKRGLVLIAEDNEENIITLSNYLEFKGYRVVVARNGKEAIARAREEKPDIFLMDIQMPIMNGLDATRRIRADKHLRTIPIIALTALAMPGDRERCLEAGADEYICKPASLKDLVKKIKKHLSLAHP